MASTTHTGPSNRRNRPSLHERPNLLQNLLPFSPHLSLLVHTTLYTIIPALFLTTFLVTGTIVLSYTLYLNQPVPTRFAIGATITFAALGLLALVLYLCIRCRRARPSDCEQESRDTDANIDEENRPTILTQLNVARNRSRARHRHEEYDAYSPGLPQTQRAELPNTVTPPDRTHRGHAKSHESQVKSKPKQHQRHKPTRHPFTSLSPLQERSRESDGPLSGASDIRRNPDYPTISQPSASPQPKHRPSILRSLSQHSLPESLRAGRGSLRHDTPMPEPFPFGTTYWGRVVGSSEAGGGGGGGGSGSGGEKERLPPVPKPLVLGNSITGRGGFLEACSNGLRGGENVCVGGGLGGGCARGR